MYTSHCLTVISLISAAWAILVERSTYHTYNSTYSFDLNLSYAPKWMSSFPDSTNLTSLSIPGTHDTMTSYIVGPVYQCQNHYLPTQLSAGLRYFDIRGRVVNDTLQIYHNDTYTGFSYTYVLSTVFSFLNSNPSEVVLMRIKEETTPINSTMDFETAFNYYRLNNSVTAPGCAKHFWIPATPGPTAVPTLGDLRGKVLILQNFGEDPAPYGIKWESDLLEIEDLYEIDDVQELPEKWDAVRENIEAAGDTDGKGQLYLSHTSASIGVLPIQAAAGPLNGSETGINDDLGQYLKNASEQTIGVIMMDFPGAKLVSAILAVNKGLKITNLDVKGMEFDANDEKAEEKRKTISGKLEM